MTWRGTTDNQDRIFSSLAYLVPLAVALPYGLFLFRELPLLGQLFMPLVPFARLYGQFPFGLLIFFGLLFAVVRNERISHFIRFNTMQALLLDLALVLFSFLLQIIGPVLGGGGSFLIQTLYNVLFLGTLAAVIFSVVQCVRGLYAELPAISEAVYGQVR